MTTALQVLADNRDALLLAEVAAWLHDWQKCIDMAVASQWRKNSLIDRRKIKEWQERGTSLKPAEFASILESASLNLGPETVSLKELIETGRDPSRAKASGVALIQLLGVAHDVGHVEKELEVNEAQNLATDWLSSPFGWDRTQPSSLLSQLLSMNSSLTNFVQGRKGRSELLSGFRRVLERAWGDTRQPINEVTLWDWSSIVAALYKAELARCVLTNQQRQPQDVSWRLLSIRTDGLDYLFATSSIPDLLARKALLANGWNRVQALLEETYPLGLQVYRDENGAAFVVPDIENLTGAATDPQGKTLREYILEAFLQATVKDDPCLAIQGEIVPELRLDSTPWKGQPAPQELPPIGEHAKKAPPLTSDPIRVRQFWCTHQGDICTVCGLRPQGPSSKALNRNVCDVCEQRRADRAREWALKKLHTTIWTDEVADVNGRLALVVGQFDLTHWLSGDLVRTLAVRDPANVSNKTADEVAKNPSFARLRRIWETTRRFWQDVLPTDRKEDSAGKGDGDKSRDKGEKIAHSVVGRVIGSTRSRLQIAGQLRPNKTDDTPGLYHAYDLKLDKGGTLSVVWDPRRKIFITADNLDYLAKPELLGAPVIDSLKGEYTLEEPAGYRSQNKTWGEIQIESVVEMPNSGYTPVIPILSEPRTFMALVPANKALTVVRAIKAKYEREMGKVRNRLPLHLGVVYAGRRTPLRAVLDAGRRMLNIRMDARTWEVDQETWPSSLSSSSPSLASLRPTRQVPKPDRLPLLRLMCAPTSTKKTTRQFDKWRRIVLKRREHGFEQSLTWYVPAVMGDGQTEDHWYPYVFLASPDEPTGRNRYYKTDAGNPWNPDHPWLIHAGELRPGDSIYFTPATLDFIWLDAGGRRFEVAYDEQGRRWGLPRRPYLLDELETLDEIWKTLRTHLTNNQIYALNELIEKRREEWQLRKDDSSTDAHGKEAQQNNTQEDASTFRQFCRDALANAAWRSRPWNNDREAWLDRWADYALRGWLADVVELRMAIMKEDAITESTPQETAQ